MCINNTSHLIYPIKRSNNRKLFIWNTKFTLRRTKIANFNSAKTFKIENSQTFISVNISSFTVLMGTPSKTILNQLRYLYAKFGAFVQHVMIFSLSHLTIVNVAYIAHKWPITNITEYCMQISC